MALNSNPAPTTVGAIMFIILDVLWIIVYNYRRYWGVNSLGKKAVVLLPQTKMILETMGEQIKLARLRRKISAELVSERAGISRSTLWAVEKGSPCVSIGIYAAVLHSLTGMDKELLLIAKDDELGRKLQDLALPIKKRAPKNRGGDDGKQ